MTALAKQFSPTFTIESYRDVFCDSVGRLIVDIQREEFGVNITYEEQPDLKNIPEFYQRGNSHFWVALDQGMVIGTIALLDAGNHICLLRKMFVHKDYRGADKGVGQALFDTLLRWCESHDIEQIYLGTIDKFKAAQRFYEKNGFHAVEENELPQIDSRIKMKVDNTYYRKEIKR